MDTSVNAPTKQAPAVSKWVWYESNAALDVGEAVCYNFDYGTSTDADARRVNHVETPSTTNAQWFAGVSAAKHSAKAGGQLIEIYCPGSVCLIRLGVAAASTTVGVGLVTFDVTSDYEGQFRYEGLPGAGSAVPLEETTTGTAQTCLALLQEGPQSGGVEVVQLVDDTAFEAMVGGTTLMIGGAFTTNSPAEEVLDGTIEGLRKKFEVITTAATTGEAHIDIEDNNGQTSAGSYDLYDIELGAIGDQCVLEWIGGTWTLKSGVGMVEATS